MSPAARATLALAVLPLGLLAPLVLGALGGCASNPGPAPEGATGAELYAWHNCANCHDDDKSGTWVGPALRELSAHWTVDTLADFLADPKAFAERDERLEALDGRYLGSMGPYDDLRPEERRRLAAWLLGQPDAGAR